MRLLIGLATLVSLAVGMTSKPSMEGESANSLSNPPIEVSSRVAPPSNLRIMNQAPAPIVSQDQLLNPVGSSVLNPGLAGVGNVPYLFPPVRINVDQSSQLFVPPGSEGRITVLLTNDGPGDLFLINGGDDHSFFLQFEFLQVQIGIGQTVAVPGRVRVPAFAPNVVSTLTVMVQRRTDGAISRRQIYIRTKSEPSERWAPWCNIRTVTRCDNYLDESICAQRYWNMRAEVQDSEAGLLSISIKPDGRFLGENFPVGINESVAVEQSVSCCTTGVDITATDVRGNKVTCRADQYSIYLSSGDVAAIVLGVLLLILLLILLILVIYKCCKRRKSVKTAPLPTRKKEQS